MGRKKTQIQKELMDSCGTLDVTPGGLLYTLIETLAIKLSDTESAIENLIAGLDPVTCTPDILVSLAANIGLYPFAKLSPVISALVSDDINLKIGDSIYICGDSEDIDEVEPILATVSDINDEKIYLETREAGQEIHNRLMNLINDDKIKINTFSKPVSTYILGSVFVERVGRDEETHESFRARYLSNTSVSPFGGNPGYIMELINKYDSNVVSTYSKPRLSTDKMLCAEVYIAQPDADGINKPKPLKSSEYAFLESKINEECSIGVSISCKPPYIVPTQENKLLILVQMAHGQKIPEDTIIQIAQEYCYKNICNFKCSPLKLYDLKVYIQTKMYEHGVKDISITTHDEEEIIEPNKDEWCMVHRNNVEFGYIMR